MKLHWSLKNISSVELQLHSPKVIVDPNNPNKYENEAITYMILDMKYSTDVTSMNQPYVYITP